MILYLQASVLPMSLLVVALIRSVLLELVQVEHLILVAMTASPLVVYLMPSRSVLTQVMTPSISQLVVLRSVFSPAQVMTLFPLLQAQSVVVTLCLVVLVTTRLT